MDRAEGLHHARNNQGLDIVVTGLSSMFSGAFDITAGSVDLVMRQILPSTQVNQDPSTPTLSDLTTEDLERLNRTHPFSAYLYQKHADAFDKTHALLIEKTFLNAGDLAALKKDYLTLIAHQINRTPDVEPNYLQHYAKILKKQLIKSPAHAIKLKKTVEQTSKITDVDTSLAYLWKTYDKKEDSNSINKFFDKMARAHGLIQFIGWSTQNENSLLAILDAWNYYRYADDIAEKHFIIKSLLTPFGPLVTEYQNIAFREKNTLLKIIRTAIPLLIIAGFIISMTALIPVALPELAFAILAVPLVYLGFALASLYVETKELAYQSYRFLRYNNDLNLFPEFQTNDQVNDAFQAQAEAIRSYYIQAIKACDDIEKKYQGQKTFTRPQIELRDENLDQRSTLMFEWFDLRDNIKLATDETPYIALKRLNADKKRWNQTFNDEVIDQKNELDLQAFVGAMSQHLHHELMLDLDEEPELHEIQDIEEAPALALALAPLSSLSFFPKYTESRAKIAESRAKIIEIQNLEAQIAANL
ncbi:MAG: hypothetical protein P1U36_06090 [Legionellaceae bacterium]|nr:hypothetical protein [Legionellaceae bacterium]